MNRWETGTWATRVGPAVGGACDWRPGDGDAGGGVGLVLGTSGSAGGVPWPDCGWPGVAGGITPHVRGGTPGMEDEGAAPGLAFGMSPVGSWPCCSVRKVINGVF